MSSEDYRDKIALKGHVMDERGQYYVINGRGRKREGKKLTAEISCTHVMFRLADFKVPYASYVKELYGAHISQLTDRITAATNGRFTFVLHDTFDLYDVKDWGRTNCLAALNDIIRMYDVEIEPDNFTIHVRKKIGGDYGHQYRIGKNVISSVFKDDGSALTTRLYARMKDDRTWIGQPATILTAEERARLQTIPGAIVGGILQVNYLVSEYAAAWSTPDTPFYDAEIIEQNITNVNDLLRQARKVLAENEVPALEVNVDAADVFKLDGTETRAGLGDTVYCVDPEMELPNITARITEITEFPYDINKHTQVTVANVMGRDMADIIADLDRSKRIVHDIMSGGQIRTDVFEAFAKQAIVDITNSKTEIVYPEEGGILAREKGNPLRQVRLTSAGLGVSTDGWRTIRAAITADGIIGERIIGQIGNFESLSIGSGNDIILLNRTGLSAGHAIFGSAPFRVDMQGNLVANKLTANAAQIKSSNFSDGEIVGSSINVGGGNFTVSRSGHMVAESGEFRGQIRASSFDGGTITGALFRTAESGRRIEIDVNGFRSYDSRNQTRIRITTTSDDAAAALIFYGTGGRSAGEINSYANNGWLTIYSDALSLGSNSTSNPISIQGETKFIGNVDFRQAFSVYGLSTSMVDGLQAALNRKVDKGLSTSSASGGAHNHGIPNGTQFKDITGVVWTWSAYSGFSHSHTV